MGDDIVEVTPQSEVAFCFFFKIQNTIEDAAMCVFISSLYVSTVYCSPESSVLGGTEPLQHDHSGYREELFIIDV